MSPPVVFPLSGVSGGGAGRTDGSHPQAALGDAEDGRGLAMRAGSLDQAAAVPHVPAGSGWSSLPAGLADTPGEKPVPRLPEKISTGDARMVRDETADFQRDWHDRISPSFMPWYIKRREEPQQVDPWENC